MGSACKSSCARRGGHRVNEVIVEGFPSPLPFLRPRPDRQEGWSGGNLKINTRGGRGVGGAVKVVEHTSRDPLEGGGSVDRT